jgi:prolyl oligopeptidase
MSRRILLGVICSFLVVLIPVLAAIPPAPVAKQIPVVADYFGTKITDPYRWMEKPSPEFDAYLHAQNDRTRAAFDAIPGRAALLERLKTLGEAVVSSNQVQRHGNVVLYEKTARGSNTAKVYVREGFTGAERVLIDPDRFGTSDHHASIRYWVPSNNGKLVAAATDIGGSENTTLHIFDVATGKIHPDAITRADFQAQTWRADDKAFYYVRLQALAPGAPANAKYQNVKTYMHVLGTDAKDDVAIFGRGVSPGLTIGPDQLALCVVPVGSPFAFGLLLEGVAREITAYVTPKSELGTGHTRWTPVVTRADGVTQWAFHGNDIYLLSHANAPRYKVVKLDGTHPDFAHATTVVAPSARVVQVIAPAKDALYVQELEDGLGRVSRVTYSGERTEIPLPLNGTVDALEANSETPGFLAKLEGWIDSPLWYVYDPAQGHLTDTKIDARSTLDMSGITSEEVKVKARDGTLIPLSLVHRKDMRMDGTTPFFMIAYGSYGQTMNPVYSAQRMVVYERGAAYAIAHVRGGGEYGDEWHLAGKDANKINTITDYIDCAQWLIDNKYTSPDRLGGGGGSAGGIPIGGAITQAPQLFSVFIDAEPLSDTLTFENTATGALNIPEFGSVKTEQGFKNLLAVSAYAHVKPGVKYPAVILLAGANDPRILPWQPAKFAAALQRDTTGDRPILLRVTYDSGHGTSAKDQANEEDADEFSFTFWNWGLPGFKSAL